MKKIQNFEDLNHVVGNYFEGIFGGCKSLNLQPPEILVNPVVAKPTGI